MNIENVINKFGYEEELADILRKIYPLFITYFGSEYEPIIYEALINTPIIKCNNIYTAFKERGMHREIEWAPEVDEEARKKGDLVTVEDLKRASGVYHSMPDIEYDRETNTYKVANVKRIVAVNCRDFTSEYAKTTLIHELGHLIKSYYKEYTIVDDTLIERSGLIESKYRLSFDGEVIVKKLSSSGIGFEEGLNSIFEEDIAKETVNPSYTVVGYGVVCDLAKILFKKDIKELIVNAELMGEKEKFIRDFNEALMDDAYDKINYYMDRLYKLALETYASMFQPEKMKELNKITVRIIEEEVGPLLEEIKASRQAKLGG